MTTLLSAYVGPVMSTYLQRLHDMLRADGLRCPVYVMDSAGGVMSAELAARKPIFTIESGGAAGVVAAAQIGLRYGLDRVLSFDMGGTTAKAGLVLGGRPRITHSFEVSGKGSFGVTRDRVRAAREDPCGRSGRGGRRRRQHRLGRRHRCVARRVPGLREPIPDPPATAAAASSPR